MALPLPTTATLFLLAGLAASCSGAADDAPPVATPSLALGAPAAAIGSPIEMTYRFAVAPDAPALTDEYVVFVHFLDSDGEMMWTDDHQPPTPVSRWTPGAVIEYSRTMFIPKFPYVGETRVEIGIFNPASGDRLPLAAAGDDRSYPVATFDMRLATDNLLVVFQDGLHDTEVATEGMPSEWQWSRGDATLSFRNPRRDIRFYLQADQPAASVLTAPQQVELRIGEAVIDRFTMGQAGTELRQIPVSAAQLGEGETVEVTVAVDQTFVPAALPAMQSGDPRELGIRVFRAFVQPE